MSNNDYTQITLGVIAYHIHKPCDMPKNGKVRIRHYRGRSNVEVRALEIPEGYTIVLDLQEINAASEFLKRVMFPVIDCNHNFLGVVPEFKYAKCCTGVNIDTPCHNGLDTHGNKCLRCKGTGFVNE